MTCIKGVVMMKDFKKRLMAEGFEILNSKKDANKVCIFGAKLQGSLEE